MKDEKVDTRDLILICTTATTCLLSAGWNFKEKIANTN